MTKWDRKSLPEAVKKSAGLPVLIQLLLQVEICTHRPRWITSEAVTGNLFQKINKASQKGVSAFKWDSGNWIFSKSYEFFEKLFGHFLDFLGIFWEFYENFLE